MVMNLADFEKSPTGARATSSAAGIALRYGTDRIARGDPESVSMSGKHRADLGDIQQTLFLPVTARAAAVGAGGGRGADVAGSGDKEAKAKLCRVESGEVAVAFGPPA